ncbi:MAG: TVP38/TMEM64 family protein [Clostridia bacterium]|nr:TVP38/TMEM64 family protein [Clostridia bacterium]
MKEKFKTLKAKRILGLFSLAAVILVFGLISYFVVYKFLAFGGSAESFEAFIEGYGWSGRFVALGIQILQVFVALIPGEFVEVGLGLAFGSVEGTLICLVGVGAASALVFLLVKKWGVKLVELFVSREKINSLRFINSEKKLNTLVFVLFLIPGTPKDLLTYFVPLTKMKMSEFLCISMLARIPSVVSSTIGGDFFGSGRYLEGIILFVVTGAVSLGGMLIYRLILSKYQKRKAKKEEA